METSETLKLVLGVERRVDRDHPDEVLAQKAFGWFKAMAIRWLRSKPT